MKPPPFFSEYGIGSVVFAFHAVSAIVGEPSGKFMLGVSYLAGDNHVQVLSIGSTGALTLLASNTTSFVPRNLAVHPNGTWVYTFSQDPITIAFGPTEGFDFNTSNGTMTEMTGSPFVDLIANGGAIEQSGQFVFGLGTTVIGGNARPTVTPYAIDQNAGTLSAWPAGQISSQGFVGIDAAVFAATDAP